MLWGGLWLRDARLRALLYRSDEREPIRLPDAAFRRRISMSGITPCLWFDGNAEEAAKFYASLFPTAILMRSIALRVTTRQARQATC